MLSKDLLNVLLVQTFCARDLWGFPKGKIEENEHPHQCAIREVDEETGYDISPFINHEWYVQSKWKNGTSSGFTGMYIIPDVPMETHFKPRTEAEIKRWGWFRLSDLFEAENGLYAKTTIKVTANTFFMKEQLQMFLECNKSFKK